MVPLFIYKDTHLQRQFMKAYNYKKKNKAKRSASLQCREMTRYYVRARSLL